jgi:glycosyltransferase involved in cell wall biosynthesis
MKKAPVSVVIPVYNGERFIGETIKSVQSQTLPVDEIIVVDNNSTDRSPEIAEELGTRVIVQKKQGTPAARNLGIRESRNDWIALLDQDDLWEKEKIADQWKAIGLFPSARFIGSDMAVLYEEAGQRVPSPQPEKPAKDIESRRIRGGEIAYIDRVRGDVYGWFYSPTSATILHREVISAVGDFNEEITFCDEVEFFLRIMKRFPVAKVKKDLITYRRHDQNHSLDVEGVYPNFVKITEMMINDPDKYPPGVEDLYRQLVIDYFVQKGRDLAQKGKNS